MILKKIVSVLSAIFLLAGIAFAGDYQVTKKAGDFDVVVTFDRNPPVVGGNNVTVAIRDSVGKPVTDAKVRVDYSMPAMPGMPAMNYKSEAALNGEVYTAPMDLSMSGAWNVAVKILREGKVSTVKFNVDAQ
jgi:nitrogen fixation protein FixH